MIVYHGSFIEIKTIDLEQCKPLKDFGRGFYVTKFREQAEYWAVRNGQKYDNNGFVTEFKFDNYAFDSKQIKSIRFDTYSDEWFDFVISNRTSKTQAHSYDIVEGPVADDKIQKRIDVFLNGDISREQFLEELKWHEETHQICFCTVFSLQFLEQAERGRYVIAFSDINEQIVAQLIINFGFDEQTASDKFFNSQTFTQLADISTDLYLKDWTEIYNLLLVELGLTS